MSYWHHKGFRKLQPHRYCSWNCQLNKNTSPGQHHNIIWSLPRRATIICTLLIGNGSYGYIYLRSHLSCRLFPFSAFVASSLFCFLSCGTWWVVWENIHVASYALFCGVSNSDHLRDLATFVETKNCRSWLLHKRTQRAEADQQVRQHP